MSSIHQGIGIRSDRSMNCPTCQSCSEFGFSKGARPKTAHDDGSRKRLVCYRPSRCAAFKGVPFFRDCIGSEHLKLVDTDHAIGYFNFIPRVLDGLRRPMPGAIWEVEHSVPVLALWAVFIAGWTLVLLSTFMIDHFDLSGLRQTYLFAMGQRRKKRTHLDTL
jgi:hypothetical protein